MRFRRGLTLFGDRTNFGVSNECVDDKINTRTPAVSSVSTRCPLRWEIALRLLRGQFSNMKPRRRVLEEPVFVRIYKHSLQLPQEPCTCQ